MKNLLLRGGENPLRGVIPLGDMFFEGMVMYYNLSIKAKDFEDYCWPSIPIKVSVDLIFGIFLIFQVIVSLSAST